MTTHDVPLTASLQRCIEAKAFPFAYRVACLGVPLSDWRSLASAALLNLDLKTARKAFIRVRDLRFLELVERIEVARRDPRSLPALFVAEVLAFQGKYYDAAHMYLSVNEGRRAVEMFLALREWDAAKTVIERMNGNTNGNVGDVSMRDLLRQQAQWLVRNNPFGKQSH